MVLREVGYDEAEIDSLAEKNAIAVGYVAKPG
jgi:hypothetical protein